MLLNLKNDVLTYPYSHANWLDLAMYLNGNFHEIAITGKAAKTIFQELAQHYLPNAIIAVAEDNSNLPLLKNRHIPGKTLIYVCKNNSCKLPVETVEEALGQMNGS